MTKLLVRELVTTLSQEITVERRAIVKAVRPRLYFHNDPAGTFTISIKQGSTTLRSKSLAMATIISQATWTPGQYHHGHLNFEFDLPITLNPETYIIELSASGYTFGESAYLGWIIDHEDPLVESYGDVYADLDKPLSLQLWTYVQ